MRKQNSEIKTAFVSEADQKLKNTDSFGFVELDDFACYVIADGIDDNVDAVSAKLAVDTIISVFTQAPSIHKKKIENCLNAANHALLEAHSKMHLKASVTMVVTDYVNLRYGQVGNTRFRLYRDGFLIKGSVDQSLSMDMVLNRELPKDQLARHEQRNNLYCYLGQNWEFHPFVSKKIKLSNSDAVALLTGDLWENVDDGELQDVFADATDEPQPTADAIEDMLLSRQPQGLEKYTFAVVFINKVFVDPNRKKKIKRILLTALPVLIIAAVLTAFLVVRHIRRINDTNSMNQDFSQTIQYIQADDYIRARETCISAQKLANKLKIGQMQTDTGNYMQLIDSVIAGDNALSGSKYEDAQRDYLHAKDRSRYADNLGMSYITDKLKLTEQYMTVYDRITLGDTMAQNLQYDQAEQEYMDAKALAGQIYFDKGRDEAMAALEKLIADRKNQQKQDDQKRQSQAASQDAAASVLAKGDAAFAQGDYQSAQVYYTTAIQKYTALKDSAQTKSAQQKLTATQSKLKDQQEQEKEADGYMQQADQAYEAKNYLQAKKFYLYAKDIYENLREDTNVNKVTQKLELLDTDAAASTPTGASSGKSGK